MNERSEPRPGPGETSFELAAVTADDRLLDALGRCERVPTDHLVAGLFAAWRTDIEAEAPAPCTAAELVRAVLADLVRAALADGPAEVVPDRARAAEPDVRSAARRPVPGRSVGGRSVGGRPAPGPLAPGRRRTARRTRRLLLGAAAAVVTAALLGLGVNHAGPTNPLWPIVEVVYPDQAAVRAADHAIALASDAVTAGRYDDARQQLDLALVHVAQVRDQGAARRLREDIRRVRVGLPDDGPNARANPGSSAPAPGAPADRTSAPTTPAPTRTPGEPGRPAPAPAAPGGPPSSPAPGLHLPIPVLPSLLPSGLPLLPDDGCLLGCPDD